MTSNLSVSMSAGFKSYLTEIGARLKLIDQEKKNTPVSSAGLVLRSFAIYGMNKWLEERPDSALSKHLKKLQRELRRDKKNGEGADFGGTSAEDILECLKSAEAEAEAYLDRWA